MSPRDNVGQKVGQQMLCTQVLGPNFNERWNDTEAEGLRDHWRPNPTALGCSCLKKWKGRSAQRLEKMQQKHLETCWNPVRTMLQFWCSKTSGKYGCHITEHCTTENCASVKDVHLDAIGSAQSSHGCHRSFFKWTWCNFPKYIKISKIQLTVPSCNRMSSSVQSSGMKTTNKNTTHTQLHPKKNRYSLLCRGC